MTIADKITTLNGIKQDIKTAIEAKGVTVGSAPFSDYDTKIGEISGGGVVIPGSYTSPVRWTRTADWLTMPSVSNTENKVVILAAVFEGMANKVALQIDTVNYVVDWGDGTTDTKTGSTTAEHIYDFANPLFNGTQTTNGYKQTFITVTPAVGGQNFPVVRFQQKYAGAPAGQIPTPFLDILVSAPLCTYMHIAGANTVIHPYLQKFTCLSGNLNDVASFTYNTSGQPACPALAYVDMYCNITTTQRSACFRSCHSLEYVRMNCSNANTLTNMFQDCYALRQANITSVPAGANMSGMFNGCYSLVDSADITGLTITGNCNMGTMFQYCYALLRVTCNNATPTNIASAFTGSNNLAAVTGLNIGSNCVSMVSAFNGCSSLIIINDGVINCSYITGVNMTSAFNGCIVLQALDVVGIGAITSLQGTFTGCRALFEIKNMAVPATVTSLDATFSGCGNLMSLPVMDTTNVTNMNSTFANCYALKDISMTSVANVTTMDGTFNGVSGLQTLSITNFNTSKVTRFSSGLSNRMWLSSNFAFSGDLTLDLSGLNTTELYFDTCTFDSLTLVNTATLTNISQWKNFILNNRRLKYLSIANLGNLTQNPAAKLVPGCNQLQRCILTGLTRTTSVANCALSAVNINEMFTSLGTALSGAVMTVTDNPGASTCTPSIATAKGWTVVQ